MYSTVFTVEGVGEFPYDMLRYDGCHPLTSEDVHTMVTPRHKKPRKREVTLATHSANKWGAENCVTDARWESFLWRVIRKAVHKL